MDQSFDQLEIDDLLYQPWIRCNSMVISWLRNSVSPQICSSVMYLDDAYAIRFDLKEHFSTGDSARFYQPVVSSAVDQYQQLISLLHSQKLNTSSTPVSNSATQSSAQISNINSISSSCSSSSTWILDTGALIMYAI